MGKINIYSEINRLKSQLDDIRTQTERTPGTEKDIATGTSCGEGVEEGDIQTVGDICLVCKGGEWFYKAGTYSLPTKGLYAKPRPIDYTSIIKDLSPDPIYDIDGCTILGYKPKLYASGEFGYWETREEYPMTQNDKCEPIYGDLAGEKIRLFKVPSTATIPSFISFKGGVPSQYDAGNVEDDGAFVFMNGINISNIEFPTDPPKPLCKDNPFSIMIAERTEANKTVVGTGIAISTFKGSIGGVDYAFPKIGVNSKEYFDREVNPGGRNNFRGGENMVDAAPYIIHSPDFNFRRPVLNPTRCLFEEELGGHGMRHGLYAEGQVPNFPTLPRENQKGARQSIVLNQSSLVGGRKIGENKCVNAMTYAPAHSVVSKDTKFTYSLMNLWKESSVYVELKTQQKFNEDTPLAYGGNYPLKDRTSDESFLGDTKHHTRVINNVKTHKVTFIRELPYQYGSLISMVAIPIGLEANALTTDSISGLVGDSFINPYTVKRTSYVSDKVPQDIAPSLFMFEKVGIFNDMIGNVLNPILKVIGLQRIGDVPVSGTADPRNIKGSVRNSAGVPIEGSDRYFPHVVKTNIFFWVNSDLNVDYREVGSVEAGEVHSKRLKTLMLDSSFPDGWDWTRTFLNRFYAATDETPKWKMIARVLLNIIFTFFVGLSILIDGVSDLVQAASQIGGGTVMLQTIGAVIAIAIAMIQIMFSITWIVFWTISSIDNKAIDHILGIDLARPDHKNPDGSFSMRDGRLRQAGETNYHRYNNDLNVINNFDIAYSMSDPYRVDKCDIYDNSIYNSNPQSQNSSIDAWRNFKVNNIFTIPQDNGQAQKVFIMNEKVFVHTTDNIIVLDQGRASIETSNGSIYLGSGDLFSSNMALYGGIVEGFGGLKDPNASMMTIAGYVFPDREARTWYVFNGTSMNRLGARTKKQAKQKAYAAQQTSLLPTIQGGVEMFMDRHGDFELLKAYPNFKNVDQRSRNGIGYSAAVDNNLGRILITKRDYRPLKPIDDINSADLSDRSLFCDVSYTISFDIDSYEAMSFHSYKPRVYAWNRHDLYSFEDDRMLLHNIRGKYLTFDCKKAPFVLEIVIAMKENFKYESTLIDTECYEYDGCQYHRRLKTFNEVMAYNDNQNSGWLKMEYKPLLTDIDNMTEKWETVPLDYNLKRWAMSAIFDKIKDPEQNMFTCECDPTVLILNPQNYDKTLRDGEFRNDYMVMRFVSNNLKENEKLLVKSIITDTDYEIES